MQPISKAQQEPRRNPPTVYKNTAPAPPKMINQPLARTNPSQPNAEENLKLPHNCFFINETRDELPTDPVELSKLKLIKQKAYRNLEQEIRRVKRQAQSQGSQNEIENCKREIANLDQKLKNLSQRLQSMRDLEKKKPNQGEINECKKTSSTWSISTSTWAR